MRARWLLTVGFAGAVMADPVSSVAYAIESALIRLDGDAAALGVSMTAVVFVIALVAMSYWQIIGLFPDGGGSAEAAGAEFGTRWTFLPLGALVVDFVLTIAISVTAATSALASWIPRVHDWSIPITWGLLVVVALLVASGGRGRLLLAAMTVAFVLASIVVVLAGLPIEAAGQPIKDVAQLRDSGSDLVGIIVAMSAAMALATGIEAPASAIAEVGHLDADGRRRLGRTALVATVVVVGVLTLALTLLVVHQGAGLPPDGQTLLAATVRDALGSGVLLGGFQLTTALLLLAAAGSSLQAGPGLAKALSRAHDRSRCRCFHAGSGARPAMAFPGSALPRSPSSRRCSLRSRVRTSRRSSSSMPWPCSSGSRSGSRRCSATTCAVVVARPHRSTRSGSWRSWARSRSTCRGSTRSRRSQRRSSSPQ